MTGPPAPVSNMTVVPSTNSSVVLNWSPGYRCVVNYTIITVLNGTATNRTITTNNTSVFIDDLQVGLNYSFIVVVSNNIRREGPPSSVNNYIWNGKMIIKNMVYT